MALMVLYKHAPGPCTINIILLRIMLYVCKLCGNDAVYKQRPSGPQFRSVYRKKNVYLYVYQSIPLLILAGRLYVSVTQYNNIITRKTK